jgi:PEGA domain-containing protein
MEIRRVALTWSGETDSLIEVMRQTATRLLKPESYKGNLSLNVNVSGVSVYIDGDLVGQTPIEKGMRLSPGRHALKLAAAGFKDYEAFIDIPFDRTVPVEIKMESQLISGVVSIDKAEDFYSIGLRAGLISNSGSFVAPHLSVEFGLRLPFWDGRLSVFLESGIWGSIEKNTTSSISLGEIPVETKILVWPTQLNVVLRLLPDYPFSPYLVAGGGFYLVWQTLHPAGYAAQAYRDSVFGFQAGAGLEYRLGPGVILVEARYLHVWVVGPLREGGVDGLLGGLDALLGYRFLF